MMGYFSNGTEGEMYREAYCDRCKWDKDQSCPIWGAHLLHNYAECNKPDSILHMLIPREKAPNFGNKECFFFEPKPSIGLPFDSANHGVPAHCGAGGNTDAQQVGAPSVPDSSANSTGENT